MPVLPRLLFVVIILTLYWRLVIVPQTQTQRRASASRSLVTSRSSKNSRRNRATETYAHYSRITDRRPSFWRYPLFYLAKPQVVEVHAGECLFIPGKWWHWVMTHGRSIAFNMAHDSIMPNAAAPAKRMDATCRDALLALDHKWCDQFFLEHITGSVTVWHNKNDTLLHCSMSDLMSKSQTEPYYLITLPVFALLNQPLHRLLQSDVESVKTALQVPASVRADMWIKFSPLDTDTGLHYDDFNTLLCVVAGSKTVTLFGPEQSRYLYPLPRKV
jgi:hypothetical protein